MVKGVMYSVGGTRRAAFALDAATGEMLWMHTMNEGKRGESAPRQLSGRGLSYWTDGREERIIYVTPGYEMIALNAKTGELIHAFGKDGVVDLKTEDDQNMDLITGEVGLHATPLVVNDVIVVGAAHLPGGSPRSKTNEKGYVRGYDAKTGKRLWIFHTIPRPGEFGNDTWEKDSWSYTGNAGVWGQMSADPDLGLVLAGRTADRRLLWRQPSRRGPLWRKHRRARREDWPQKVALPACAPRHLGYGHPVRADPCGSQRQRTRGESDRAADEAGVGVRTRSRDRSAGVADRGASG